MVVKYSPNFAENHFRSDEIETRIIATQAEFVAKDGTGTTGKVNLYGVFFPLIPSHESGIRMCGAPDAYNGGGNKRCKVHVCTVHRYHDVEVTHEHQLLPEVLK